MEPLVFLHRTSYFQEQITVVKGGRGVSVYLYKRQHSSLCLLHIYDPVIQNSSTENARTCNKTLQLYDI